MLVYYGVFLNSVNLLNVQTNEYCQHLLSGAKVLYKTFFYEHSMPVLDESVQNCS
jgi:hypothetical protein